MKTLTTHQAAKKLCVHYASVIRWIDQGHIKGYRTPGNHRRMLEKDLMLFAKKFKMPVV